MKHDDNVSAPTTSRQSDNGLWEISDVASYLGVSIPTVRKDMKERGLPFKRIGRRQYFRRAEIDAWVDSQVAA